MSNPKLIPVPFANTGTYTNISTNRGSGDALEQPNYSEGFPTITSTPLAAGGKAPRREDFNGLLHDLSANISHLNKGGFFMFDVDFCAQIGGYPKGSVLLSNDKTKKYTSLIDNNTSNFNVSVDPSKWVQSGLTETEVKTIAWGAGKTEAPWAPLASPSFTGNPTTPTAAVDTSTTQVASTAFVTNQASETTPVADGTAAVGSSKRYARADHVHPTDTTRATVANFANSKTANGWQKLEGGLIIQWGYAEYQKNDGIAGTVANLPIAFPNSVLAAVVSDTGSAVGSFACFPVSLSQIKIWARNVMVAGAPYADYGCNFIAIGY